jgi:hypothetical protein
LHPTGTFLLADDLFVLWDFAGAALPLCAKVIDANTINSHTFTINITIVLYLGSAVTKC